MGLSFHEMQAAAQEMSLRAVLDEDLSNYTLCDDGRYEVYTEYTDDAVSEVDKHKNITVNEEQCNLTQEENSQYVPFKLPRYWDGVDLMTKLIQFHYVNINGGSGISTAVNVRFNDSYIICGWLINKSVTAVAGDVTFEITATGTNEKSADYRWRTRPNGKFTVLEALSYDGIIEPSDDWYAGFVKSMQEYTTKAAESARSAQDYADQSKSNLDQVTQITETFTTNAQEVKETAINEINNAKVSGVNAVEAAATEIVNDREKITENANNISSLKGDLVNLGIFKYTNSSDLISFIKSIYCPNLTGKIGVCTIVNDTDEIRINIYNVDDTGRYTSSTPLETFKFGKNEIGVIKCIGNSFNSIAQIDTVSLYQKILGTSGVTGYNSIFNQWVTYYNNMSQLTGEKAQQTADNAMQKAQEAYIGANNALEKVDALAEVCVDTELSAIGTTGTKGSTSSETWRGFRTRIANVAPICAVDIIIGLSAESEVTLSILDTSLNIICRVTKTLPVGVDTYRFDLGGNYSIDGEELFVELFSNAKTITSKTVGNSASDYVTADNRTADKGNYYSNSTGETVYWNIIKNSSIAKSYSMMFTTYTDKYVLHTHAYDGDVINPKEIYTVQDAFSVEESMPQTIYIDHMVKLSEHEDICFDKTKSDKYFICSNILTLQSANVVKTDHTIILNGFKGGKSINIQQVSTKSNIGADNPIRLLQIGDSVGGAFGGNANRVDFYGANPAPYWGVAQKLFDLDGIKANDTNKYKMQTIGFRNRFNYSVVRDGVTHASREAFGEGRGGWQLIDYLYNSIQGETGTDREPTSSNPINPFYDGSKVWTGLYADELNSAGVKFSLAHYLSAYRTHDDNGNILTVGSGTGTNIHADGTNDTNTGYIVQGNAYINTPTHILQENAFNDPDIDSFVRNTELFIKAVRNEFPNMFIGIVFNDASFGYFSEYYNEYSMDGFMNGYGNSLHEKQYDRYNKLSDMISGLGDAKVFLLPTMFIQPTLNGCHTIDAVNADGNIVKYVGNSGTYHPNNVAHSAWGSQLYAWLKYTQTLV